jgi:hypothetical protein
MTIMQVTRRTLIGGGAALAGVGAVARFGAPNITAATSAAGDGPDGRDDASVEALDVPVMISIADAQSGELEILIGEQAISHSDRRLVNRLIRAAREEA